MKHASTIVSGLVLCGMSVFAADPLPLTSVYEADTAGTIQWKPKVLAGQASVVKVFAKNGPIKAGDAVAELTIENQDETVSAIQRALMQAQRALDEAKEDAEAQAKSGALELEKARVEADRTAEVKRFWRDLGRADRLVEARQATEVKEAVIKDKEEELRQLEAKYKQALDDLYKE